MLCRATFLVRHSVRSLTLASGASVLHIVLRKQVSSEPFHFPITSPPITNLVKKNTVIEILRIWWRKLCHYLYIWYRTTTLAALLSPAIITAPMLYGTPKWWDLLRYCIGSTGPCLIKLCQWIATRPDIFPVNICHEFEQLQNSAMPHSWQDTERALTEAYGDKYPDILKIQSSGLIGCGSVAQVYKASLHDQPVAIKVLHPGITDQIHADISILHYLAEWGEFFGYESLSLVESVELFELFLTSQINLLHEAEALQRFEQNFRSFRGVSFPLPYMKHCTSGILVESLASGVILSEYLRDPSKPTKELGKTVFHLFLKMV